MNEMKNSETKETFPSAKEINYVYELGKDRLEQIQAPEGNTDFTYHSCGTIHWIDPYGSKSWESVTIHIPPFKYQKKCCTILS